MRILGAGTRRGFGTHDNHRDDAEVIRHNTVLILGAGASEPYGLPLGRELLIALCKLAKLPERDERVAVFERGGFELDDVRRFGTALHRSAANSIDTFLARRRELSDLGKLAIACEICPREGADAFHAGLNGHWYAHLWNRMHRDIEAFRDVPHANHLRVITFNYDRSLEFFLYNAILNFYGCTPDDAQAVLDQLQILHVYGQVGPFHHAGLQGGMRYGPHPHPELYVRAAAGINIIADARAESPNFAESRRWLEEAEFICFVGFGFDQLNLERLDVASVMGVRPSRPYICASTLGMTAAEIGQAKRMIVPNFEWSTQSMSSLDFLRNEHVLF